MDSGFRQAYLGQRKGHGGIVGVYPSHDAQQHVSMPTQAEQLPHSVMLTRRTAQELMRFALAWLAEVEHGKR